MAIPRAPAADDPDRLIGSAYIRADLGGISTMTFWRLEHAPDAEERLPPPDLVLGSNKQKRWTFGTYRKWKAKMLARGHIRLWRQGTPRGGVEDTPGIRAVSVVIIEARLERRGAGGFIELVLLGADNRPLSSQRLRIGGAQAGAGRKILADLLRIAGVPTDDRRTLDNRLAALAGTRASVEIGAGGAIVRVLPDAN